MSERWAVVGGGILGMVLARRLAERGHDVTLYEASDRLGGLASAWTIGEVTWDQHYHVTLLSDSYTRRLLEDLDLDDKMCWETVKSGFYNGRKLAPLTSSIDFLRLPGMGPIAKARLAATILYGSRVSNWKPLESITVEAWLRKISGAKVFDRLWRPLLRAKLGDAYTKTSAAFIWATIQRLYAARRSGLKTEMFGYLPGGYDRFVKAFSAALADKGVTVRTSAAIDRIHSQDGGLSIESGGAAESFDRVVVTAAPPIASKLVPELTAPEHEAMTALPYQGILCASVVLDQPLSPYYLTYLTDESLPFTAVVDMSALVDPAAFGGRGLVYLPLYTTPEHPTYRATDAEVREQFLEGLKKVYPALSEREIQAFEVSRVPFVFPVPVLGYSEKVAPVQTSVPGLSVLNSSHIINGTLNVNDTTRTAETFIRDVVDAASDVENPSVDAVASDEAPRAAGKVAL